MGKKLNKAARHALTSAFRPPVNVVGNFFLALREAALAGVYRELKPLAEFRMWDLEKTLNRSMWPQEDADKVRAGVLPKDLNKCEAGLVLAMLGQPLAKKSQGQAPRAFFYRSELWLQRVRSIVRNGGL